MGSNFGYAGGENLVFTSNGGNNWVNKFSSGPLPVKGFTYYRDIMPQVYHECGPYHIWFIKGNKIYHSCDNENWRAEHTSPKGNYTGILNNAFHLCAVTDAGRISRTITAYDSSVNTGNSFILMNNFPNPFNVSTNIKLRLYKSTKLKINVYNTAGELVAVLIDKNIGVYTVWPYYYFLEVNWDGTNYPSGIYFYRVIADDYTETRKMVLVK
jgi:hypothetical protein